MQWICGRDGQGRAIVIDIRQYYMPHGLAAREYEVPTIVTPHSDSSIKHGQESPLTPSTAML